MNRAAKLAWLVLSAAALIQAQSGSDVESGTNFQGRVRYENSAPAAFVRVELWTDGESTWRTFATTDRMGKFHSGAPCMVVQFKVEAPGFRPVWGRVDISTHPCRALEDITLKALPGTNVPGSDPAPSGIIDARVAGIPGDAKSEFEAGQKAVDENDFAVAIPHLKKAIELYPRYAEAYQLLGVAQLQMRRGPEAEASLKKAIEIEDKMPRAQYLLGVLLAMTNRANLAKKPFTRFAELDPTNPDAYFELAKTEFALKEFPEAELQARKAIALNEKNNEVQMLLAYSLLRQAKAEEAKETFRQYLKLDPNSAVKAEVENTIAMISEHEKQAK